MQEHEDTNKNIKENKRDKTEKKKTTRQRQLIYIKYVEVNIKWFETIPFVYHLRDKRKTKKDKTDKRKTRERQERQ